MAAALWDSGRWLHVVLALGDGTTYLNVQVIYGIAGQVARNAQFLQLVVEYTSRFGNAPHVMAGDWNVPLDRATAIPACLEIPLHSGLLIDLDLMYSRLHHSAPCAACRKAHMVE